MHSTKVFINGNSQAVRIPKEYRFEHDEVMISRVGSAVIIYQYDDRLAVLMESLNTFTADYLEEGRPEQSFQKERESFD